MSRWDTENKKYEGPVVRPRCGGCGNKCNWDQCVNISNENKAWYCPDCAARRMVMLIEELEWSQ